MEVISAQEGTLYDNTKFSLYFQRINQSVFVCYDLANTFGLLLRYSEISEFCFIYILGEFYPS